MEKTKKPGTIESWENGDLGETLDSARIVSADRTAEIQDAAGLQMISIRLPKSVIEDFKVIAQIEGVGYQPLMRIALVRFAECEAKRVMREYAAKVMNDKRQAELVQSQEAAKAISRKSPAKDPQLDKKAA